MLHVEISHLILSYALGVPVGLVKTQIEQGLPSLSGILERQQLFIESIIDLQYDFMF